MGDYVPSKNLLFSALDSLGSCRTVSMGTGHAVEEYVNE